MFLIYNEQNYERVFGTNIYECSAYSLALDTGNAKKKYRDCGNTCLRADVFFFFGNFATAIV